MGFISQFERLFAIYLPQFTGLRTMMMPVVIGDVSTVPWERYRQTFLLLGHAVPEHWGRVGYLTIDERKLLPGETHRLGGLHVDGVYRRGAGAWGGGFEGPWASSPDSDPPEPSPGVWASQGGPWASRPAPDPGPWASVPGGPWASTGGSSGRSGMLLVADKVGCRAWRGPFEGQPGPEGQCGHLVDQCREGEELQAGVAYWLSGMCVHESLPARSVVQRVLVRLSLPSNAPWFSGYDVSPYGVLPTGPILPRRPQMDRG